MIRRFKRPTVQLTSLLDLLFVMIFLSLLQTKNPPPPAETKVEQKVQAPTPPAPPKKKPLIYQTSAVFSFYATQRNPRLPSGSYSMNGSFDEKTGILQLGGSSWVNRPEGYDMVPLKGKIDLATNIFTGRIEFQGCLQFNLRKVSTGSSRTPISGKWEGIYSCSQGETGLTLTID
jgi:hypothetical protein